MRLNWSKLVLLAAAVVALVAVWAVTPGRDRFRDFDPRQVGRAEAALWRDYYEHRSVALALGLIAADRNAFGLSPWDSLMSGLDAAEAARTFQRSRSRAQAQAALPALTRHFAILARATRSHFEPATAARLELEWWRLRRESDSGPQAYAPAVAAATAYIYGVDAARLTDYARLRSEAMQLRDDRGARITDADWARISNLLQRAYASLKSAVAPR